MPKIKKNPDPHLVSFEWSDPDPVTVPAALSATYVRGLAAVC